MFKIADAERFLSSEKISGSNREILKKYFSFLRHDGTTERTALNHMENMVWNAQALKDCDLGKLTEDDLYTFLDALDDYIYTNRAGKKKKYSDSTKESRKVSLKKFLKWNQNFYFH